MSVLCSMVGASFTVTVVVNARTAKIITANGNAQVSTAQSKFGGASMLSDGTGDCLQIATNSDFAFGTGDFSIEFFIRPTTNLTGTYNIWDQRATGAGGGVVPAVYISGNAIYYYTNGDNRIAYAITLQSGTWYHFALTRSGTSTKMFLDGTQVGSTYTDTNSYVASQVVIGAYAATGSYSGSTPAYFDEIRVSNSARYTTTFTPTTSAFANDNNTLFLCHADGTNAATVFVDDTSGPGVPTAELADDNTTELLLHMNGSAGGTTFTDDNSTGRTAKTITRYSVTTETAQKQFGTASMLSSTSGGNGLVVTGTNNLLQWYAGNYCAEAWIYPTSFTNISGATVNGVPTGKVIGNMSRDGGAAYWNFGPTSTGALSWYMWDPSIGSRGFTTATAPIVLNAWQHIAVQYYIETKVIKIFVNGVLVDSWAVTSNTNVYSDNAAGLSIGSYNNSGFPGYIDDVRVSRQLRY
jgi:hypothetical protein